jgi:hypothetical protein
MEYESLLGFHEKLYFHEFDSKEKLTARLQLCLAMLTVLIGLMAYIVAHFHLGESRIGPSAVTLLVTFTLSAALLIAASYKFICALWGYRYECLPFSGQIEDYRGELLKTYASFDDGKETAQLEYDKFLVKYMSECTSKNAALNTERYEHLHDSISYIVYSIPPIVIAGLAFVIGGFLKGTP